MSSELVNRKDDILSLFQCHKTGNCCRVDGFVYATDSEVAEMAKLLSMDIFSFRQRYVVRQDNRNVIASPRFRPDCFLDSKNGCAVYQGRPQKCRTYPNWPELWTSDDVLLKETTVCKGLREAIKTLKDSEGL